MCSGLAISACRPPPFSPTKALTSPDLDVNEGCFRPLEVVLPEGTMLSAKPPSALGLWSIALPTVIDTILKALAPALPRVTTTRPTPAASQPCASASGAPR